MTALKLTQSGNSVGLILPKEVLARLKLEQGDTVFVTDAANGVMLTPYDPALDAQLEAGREFMREYRDTFHQLAAAYGVGLAKNHPFVDGNERAAFLAVGVFLLLNGWWLTAAVADATLAMLAVAAGQMDEVAFAHWLRQHGRARSSRVAAFHAASSPLVA
jgi:putative addiction module antidote